MPTARRLLTPGGLEGRLADVPHYCGGMRIVSLLPSATEILFALGVGDDVIGVTHECDYPAAASDLPRVTEDLLASGLSPSEIDAAVAASVSDIHTIYRLHEDRLRALEPDVIVTQNLCEVCAIPTATVEAAICTMPRAARVVASDPHTLDDLLFSIAEIGHQVGAPNVDQLVGSLSDRLAAVRRSTRRRPHPTVAALEWPDPPFVPGHWVPDMVEAAGGVNLLGTSGEKSSRTAWHDLTRVNPDVVLLAFCGFDLGTSVEHFEAMCNSEDWLLFAKNARVFLADGSAYFSRPGPRLIDGVEMLAYALHGIESVRPPRGRIVELNDDGWTEVGT